MLSKYSLNSHVTVCINRQIAAGLLGLVDGDQRAIIRNREISWDSPAPPDRYVGQTLEALVLGLNPDYNQLELSLRLVERDPWPGAASCYAVGTEVTGQVVGLIEAGAFIEVEPGVEGFLPARDLIDHATERIGELLWLGDHVRAVVTEVKIHRRQLRLSLSQLLIQREVQFQRRIWHDTHAAPTSRLAIAKTMPVDVWRRLMQLGSDVRPATTEFSLQVLVIEDDPVYAAGLESFLVQNGCQVVLTADGPAGLGQIRSQTRPFDLIVIDWNLPGPKGHEIVQKLQLQGCSSRLVLVLEWTPLLRQPKTWDELRESDVDVFFKAQGDRCMEGLVSILRELREGRSDAHRTYQRHFPTATLPASFQVSDVSTTGVIASPTPSGGLGGILAQLRDDTEASAVLLMRLGPDQARLQVENCAGECDAFRNLPPDLIHSALADILVRHQEVEERVTLEAARFRRLLALRCFEGFLGLPVPGARAVRYGLILLRDEGTFNQVQGQKARLAAYLIAGVLQQRGFIDAVELWQSQYLLGQLASSVVHEVTNKLGGLGFQIKTLEGGLKQLARYPPAGGDPKFLHAMEQAVAGLAKAQQQTSELRERYLGLATSDDPGWVQVNTVAEETIEMLKPEAQQHNILLEIEVATDLPRVWARPGQLRQILLNLVLNPIQLMAAIRRPGIVKIKTSHATNAHLPVQVRIIDEGPGAHACLWERIFGFGFTTKKNGAGLGLTICRQITSKLGGAVQVEASHMLLGTTFLLELPGGEGNG